MGEVLEENCPDCVASRKKRKKARLGRAALAQRQEQEQGWSFKSLDG